MFGLTNPQVNNTNNRRMQNDREELRKGMSSNSFDNSYAERLRMEYLKEERERRERERNKMILNEKKSQERMWETEFERYKNDKRRYEAEINKYTHDLEGIRLEEKRESSGVENLKKQKNDLTILIQKLESELQALKNKFKTLDFELTDKLKRDQNIIADTHKREDYLREVKSKLDNTNKMYNDSEKKLQVLKKEIADLQRLV